MSLDQLISASFRDLADEADLSVMPTDIADAALHRRARQRTARVMTASAAVVAVAAAIAVPTIVMDQSPISTGRASPSQPAAASQPSSPTAKSTWVKLPLSHAHTGNTSISAHPSEGPPVHLIAADDVALSAYYTESGRSGGDSTSPVAYHWSLYQPWTRTYQKVPWANLDVSPGLGLAAVLEGPAATNRIGIINLRVGSMLNWIHTSHPVGMVAFSPDGTRLVATTYAPGGDPRTGSMDRNGFITIDLTNGQQTFHVIPHDQLLKSQQAADTEPYNGAVWTADGKYVYFKYDMGLDVEFFRPNGSPAHPAHAAELSFEWGLSATISPDGTKANAGFTGQGSVAQTSVKTLDGATTYNQPVQQLLAWANNGALVAWGCGNNCAGAGEFQSRLVLTSLDGRSVTTLSGPQKGNDASPGQWEALMTRR